MVWRPKKVDLLRGLKLTGWGLLLMTGLGVTFLISAYQTMKFTVSGRQIPVPDLIHMKFSEAEDLLNSMNLKLEVSSERYDPRTGKDRILEQDPLAASQIKPMRKVRVILSLGTMTLLVPDLRGSSSRKAQITLRQEGLRVGDTAFLHSSTVEENHVIAQDPPPSIPRQKDGRVNLLVSRGPREARYIMPDLIGRDLSEVRTFLGLVGMKIGQVREDPLPGRPTGKILRQYPPSGHPVTLRQPVTLVVTAPVAELPEEAPAEELIDAL